MVDSFYKGIVIGLCTSIPVGPIALLCIQRTLQKGRLHGFFSGLGAATSDCLYAMAALLGLSFVMSFIKDNTLAIQIAGSIIMMLFAMFIFFQNPTKALKKTQEGKDSYANDYITSFLLTLSNPLIIFLFLGLFARFKFISASSNWFEIIWGLIAVFIGAAIWWFFLTLVASSFRKRLNIRGLSILNKITGSLIFILALVTLICSLCGQSMQV